MAGSFGAANYNVAYTATNVGITLTGLTAGYSFRITTTSTGTTIFTGGASAPSTTTSRTISGGTWPAPGASTTMYMQENQGSGFILSAIASATITRAAVPVPTSITFSDPGTDSNIVTITMSGVGGSGTYEYSADGVTGWTTTATVSATRGTQFTRYVRSSYVWNTVTYYSAASTAFNYTPSYIAPDTSVTSITVGGDTTTPVGSPLVLTYNSTADVAVSWVGGSAIDYYRVVRITGGVVIVIAGVQGGTSGTLSFAEGDLPPAGSTWQYELEVRRAVADGGNGNNANCTDTTNGNNPFYISREAPPDETPESYTNLASNITGAGHNQQYFASFAATAPALGGGVLLGGVATAPTYTVSGLGAGVTVTASVTAGNASFSITGVFGTYYTSASVTNGTVIICQLLTPNTVNTAETYTLQIGTVPQSVTITTGPVLPDRLVNLTVTPYGTGVIPFGQTSATVQVSGGTSGHEYTIGSGSGTNGIETVLATPVAADGSGNATITIPNANLPTNATQWVNRLRVRAPAGIGGNNIWSTWGTGSINGGASGNLIWNWSRATSATTLGVGTVSRTPAGDISGSITSVVVNFTGTINHKYKLVQTAPSVADMVVGSVLGATGATSLTLTSAASALPGENNVWTYKVQVIREIANGGDGIWYDATGTAVSFTIFRIYNPTVANDQGFDTTYNNTFFTHQMKLKVEGNGGIHEFAYADTGSSTGTYPTTWSTDRSCVVARGTSYYFWSRRRAPGGPSTDASDFDRIDTPVEVPAWQGIDVTDSTYGIQINNASGVPVLTMASRIIRLLDSGTTAAVAAGASYTSPPISSIDTYINSHVAIISPSDAVYKLNSFSVSVDYTAKTFTVINNTGSSKTFSFYVFRSG